MKLCPSFVFYYFQSLIYVVSLFFREVFVWITIRSYHSIEFRYSDLQLEQIKISRAHTFSLTQVTNYQGSFKKHTQSYVIYINYLLCLLLFSSRCEFMFWIPSVCFDLKPSRKDTLADDIKALSVFWISHRNII